MTPSQKQLVRLTELINNDLDYSELDIEFYNLIELAKITTGLEVSFLNLIDIHHFWPISQSGDHLQVMPLQNTPCQYTILKDEYFEVKDLSSHEILKEMDYVKAAPFYKYYFGVPLKTQDGINIGSLCLFDTQSKELNPTQIDILKILAREAVTKIESLKAQNRLRKDFFEYVANQRSIANDIRNPLAGIIGLSDILIEQFMELEKEEARDYNLLINTSSKSILTILDDIIIHQKKPDDSVNIHSLKTLKERLNSLYSPLLTLKKVQLSINLNDLKSDILFLKNHVNYLIGNLLVEALLNIEEKATLTISLDLIIKVHKLYIKAEFTSDKILSNQNLANNEALKIYQSKVEELNGELNFNKSTNYLYELILPLKSI